MSVDVCQNESEKKDEGIIKYPTADVKSGRKMHHASAVLVTAYEFTLYSLSPFSSAADSFDPEVKCSVDCSIPLN